MNTPLPIPAPLGHAPVSAGGGLSAAGPWADGLVLEQGRVIAKKYVLDRPAGFGGMAQLWVATNQATGAEVCVKLLVPDPEEGSSQDAESVERFRREARAAARLSHRAIVRVFDLLELDEKGEAAAKGARPHAYAIVMELLHGETLGDMLAKRGKVPVEEALDLFLPVLSALGHAHAASVIHRDLKPDNLFLATEPDGQVIPKVLDFGVSKLENASALTVDGVLVGTPTFMSPEQASGARRIDARSDVFSSGILLYTMLSGRNPFEDAPTFAATVDAVLRRPLAPIPDLDASIAAVLRRATEKEPELRFADATEMAIALQTASGRRVTTRSSPSFPFGLTAPTPRALMDSSPSGRPSAVDVSVEDAPVEAIRRRRSIALGIVGVAVILVLAAVTVTVATAKDGATPAANEALPNRAPAVQRAAESAPNGSAAVQQAPSTSAAVPDASSAKALAPSRPAASPRRNASGPVNPTNPVDPANAANPANPATKASIRKPGQEPHNARDPGF